jgi:hypothetical protein
VTLENWRLLGPKITDIFRSAVRRQLNEADLPEDLTTRFPYSVMATDEAESTFQVIDSCGIPNFLDPKVRNAEFLDWEWSGYSRDRYPKFEYRALFEEEYRSMFSHLLGASAQGEIAEAAV